jgi:2'-deoxynucleoside 5'-phosphate N-hydrolase
MNIYFSCSITGGRNDQKIYKSIVDHLLELGHEVPTAHLSDANVTGLESVVDPIDVFERDYEWVNNCDVLIAEVSTPSHGVGYEVALALEMAKPVLCLHKQGVRVSKMITGNTKPTIQVTCYKAEGDALARIDEFLDHI